MKSNRKIKWSLLISLIGISTFAFAFLVIRVNAQTQTIDDLNTLLTQKGIPIKSMTTMKQIPFIIKISIQSKSNDKNLQPDDLYYAQIARKAASLFYRYGQRIDGYELEIVNSEGVSLSWESNNIFPSEISQRISSSAPSKLSDKDTTSLVQTSLKLHGLSLDKINISSQLSLGDSGQELTLQLSTTDISRANQDLIPFLLSLHSSLDEINAKNGTNITLCWLRVFDKKGNQLLNYVWDLETREETSIQAPGIAAWYPVPAPIPTNINTPATKIITPIPSTFPNYGGQAYPPPSTPIPTPTPLGPTPTNHPYP